MQYGNVVRITVRTQFADVGYILWRLFPAHTGVGGIAIPAEDWPRIQERGWIKINGCRAMVHEQHPDAPGWVCVRIQFDEPYPYSHP